VRIPLIDFALVGVIYLIWLVGFWTWRRLRGQGRREREPSGPRTA